MFVVHFSPNISRPNIFSIHIFSLHQLINNLALLSSLVYKGKVDGTMAIGLTTALLQYMTQMCHKFIPFGQISKPFFLFLLLLFTRPGP